MILSNAAASSVPPSNLPTEADVSRAYGSDYFNDGSSPEIRDLQCATPASGMAKCDFRMIRDRGEYYNQCRGELVESGGHWAFKNKAVIDPKPPYSTYNFEEFCSPVNRSTSAPRPTRRVSRPTLRSFKRDLYQPTYANHAVYYCPKRVESLECSPVRDDLSQFNCTYQDKGRFDSKWVKRNSRIELGRNWMFVDGDKPECDIYWDIPDQE